MGWVPPPPCRAVIGDRDAGPASVMIGARWRRTFPSRALAFLRAYSAASLRVRRPARGADRWRSLALCAGSFSLAFGLGWMRAHRFPLSGDESLYAFWARHWMERGDPLFVAHWIDKPPLYAWLQAAAFALFGPAQASARYVNIGACALLSAILCRFAWRMWGWRAAAAAGGLAALHPLLLAYSPTGLTDPVCVLCGTVSFLLAWRRRYLLAGATGALALFTKQAGAFYLPLAAGIILVNQIRAPDRPWRPWGAGAALVALPLQLWDMTRWAWAPSFWTLGFDHYAPLRGLPPAAWGLRWQEWSPLWAVVWGSGLGWASWGLLLGLACRSPLPAAARASRAGVAWMLVWSAGYLGVHLVVSFNAWIRYLLPVVPLAILSAAWALDVLGRGVARRRTQIASGLALVCLLAALGRQAPAAWQGSLPTQLRPRALAGMPETLAYLARHAPPGALLFHNELSWHILFYLFDDARLTRVWFADAEQLAQRIRQTPRAAPKYQVRLAQDQERTDLMAAALAGVGFRYALCLRVDQATLYEIQRQTARACRLARAQP